MLESCSEAIAAGDGREVFSLECGGAASWELTAEGQLKSDGMCLTQSGSYAGDEDVAHGAPVHATSSSEESSHGAVKAVDGNEKTYWVSALDAEGEQHLTIDLGDARTLVSAVIEWELPAMKYGVQLSTDGKTWTEAHPVYAQWHGKTAYGIRRIAVISPRLHSV